MTKLLKKIRSVLRGITTKAKVKITIAINIMFFKFEASYEKDMSPPPDPS